MIFVWVEAGMGSYTFPYSYGDLKPVELISLNIILYFIVQVLIFITALLYRKNRRGKKN